MSLDERTFTEQGFGRLARLGNARLPAAPATTITVSPQEKIRDIRSHHKQP